MVKKPKNIYIDAFKRLHDNYCAIVGSEITAQEEKDWSVIFSACQSDKKEHIRKSTKKEIIALIEREIK